MANFKNGQFPTPTKKVMNKIKLNNKLLVKFSSFFLNFGPLYRSMGSKINKITKDATLIIFLNLIIIKIIIK